MNEDCFLIENEYSSLKNHIIFHGLHHDVIPVSLLNINLLEEFYNTDIKPFDFAKPSPDDIALSSANKSFTHVSSKKKITTPKKGPIVITPKKVPTVSTQKAKVKDETKTEESIKRPKKVTQMTTEKRQMIISKIQKYDKKHFNVAFAGDFNSGKSTLLGHLLYLKGMVDSKTIEKYKRDNQKAGISNYHFAFVLDELQGERSKQISFDIAKRTLNESNSFYHLYDTPGYTNFLDRTIACINNCNYAFVIIDVSTYIKNQEKNNLFSMIVRTSGILSITIVLNKIDLIDYDENVYNVVYDEIITNLKKSGFKENNITIIPCSGLHGDNIIKKSAKMDWYKGPTLFDSIKSLKIPKTFNEKPFLMSVDECYKDFQATNFVIKGKVHYGFLTNGDHLLLMPQNQLCTIKSLRFDGDHAEFISSGCNVEAVITGPEDVNIGNVLCDPENPITTTNKFEAQIVTFQLERELINGDYCNLHIHQSMESARIKLLSIVSKETQIKRPKRLGSKKTAIVLIQTSNPIGIDTFKNNPSFGRFLLTNEGKVIGAGMVTKIL